MTNSIKKLTKIANKHPEMRKHIVPIIKQAGYGIHYNNTKMLRVLDAFARFLTGDADQAISMLKILGNPDVSGLSDLVDSDPRAYTDLHLHLYTLFLAAVKRTLK